MASKDTIRVKGTILKHTDEKGNTIEHEDLPLETSRFEEGGDVAPTRIAVSEEGVVDQDVQPPFKAVGNSEENGVTEGSELVAESSRSHSM